MENAKPGCTPDRGITILSDFDLLADMVDYPNYNFLLSLFEEKGMARVPPSRSPYHIRGSC